MNTHSIELDGYYARSRGNSTIYLGTAGSHGNEQLQVTQGKGWEGLTVQVVFHPCKVAVQLPANGVLDVPWEATARPLTAMQGRIVFQGFDQDRLVNSTDLAYTVASHSPALGRDEQPYTPGIVEGVLNQMAADKDAILQAAQQTGQAKEAAAASAAEAASSAANAQQSAGAANTSASQAAGSASQAVGSAAAANETLTQVQTAGQEAQQKVKDAETEALDKIAAAAPALPAVSTDAAWQSVTAKPDGSGYNLAAMAPIEASIRPTANGNPAVCEDSIAWSFQGLKVYGKSTQDGTPSPETPVPIVSAGEVGSITLSITDGAEQSQSLTLSTPSGLPGIPVDSGGNYTDSAGQQRACDVVDFKNRIKIKYCAAFKKESGTPLNFVETNLKNVKKYWINVKDGGTNKGLLCDKLIFSYSNIDEPHIYIEGNTFAIFLPNDVDPADFACDILYPLETPVTTAISDEDFSTYCTLTSYDGTTMISTAEPVAGLEVRYVSDGSAQIQQIVQDVLNALPIYNGEVETVG